MAIRCRPTDELTHAQEIFAIHYAEHGNGAAAARAAYPRLSDAGSDQASERGRKLLRKSKILARVAELRGGVDALPAPDTSELERLAMKAFDATQPDVVRLLALRALSAGLIELCSKVESGGGAMPRVVVRISVDAGGDQLIRSEVAAQPRS